ncbi:MAG TPA: glycosyl hydrolase [Gemmatimonadaceae bacterium]|nr:glycosyl hydrolase [Gemmatimonadaceae bacterium]
MRLHTLAPLTLLAGLALSAPRAVAQDAVPDSAFFAAFKWRSIGPNRGGRSLAVAGSASRPLEYYFGAVGGGLWKTTDGGTTWKPVTDGQIKSSSVGAVAVSASNPDIVYIGMGETELRGNVMQGDGVYKSTDGGKTWTHMGLDDTQAIARIRVDPSNPDLVYVAAMGHPFGRNAERGVFRSKDGGKTWQKILFMGDSVGAEDLVIDPSNSKVLYATFWKASRTSWSMDAGGPGGGIFKSTDGGDHWTDLTRNPGMPKGLIGKIGVSVSGADPNRVYAIVEAEDGGVFRSDDGGKSWTKTNDERKLRQRAFYYTRIYADPKDKDRVYVLNVNFFRSDDGGKTFDTSIRVPHGDNHDLWIAPNDPQRMIEGDDGGGTVSTNGGETWTDEDYPTAQSYHVATTVDVPYQVCGAQQDNSTFCVSSTGRGDDFYSVGGGESGYIAPDPKDPNVFYAGSQGALLTRFDRSNDQVRDVQVYPRFFSGEPSSALPERWQWTYPIVFSPKDPHILYTSSQHLFKTTDEGQTWQKISPDLTLADPKTLGVSGGPITHDMNGPEIYATIFTIAPSHFDTNVIWTGSDDGLAYITRDGGAHWTNITPKDLPKYSRISLIEASPTTPGTAYLAAKRYQLDDRAPYIYRTHDYGQTWTKIITGIRAGDYVHAVREDPTRKGLLYAGTEHGIYISFDDGDHWHSLSLNLPDVQVPDIAVEKNDLVIATHGRSMYVLDDIGPIRQFGREVASAPVHLFAPSPAVRGLNEASIQYSLDRNADTVKIEILDASGRVIRTMMGGYRDTTAASKRTAREGSNAAAGMRASGSGGQAALDSAASSAPKGCETSRRGRQSSPTGNRGLNRFTWDLTYPGAVTFPCLIMWGASAERGPIAVPGDYQIRLTANGVTQTQPLTVKMDPRLKGVTQADLAEQFALAMKVRDRVSDADNAVIRIRAVRQQVESRMTQAHDKKITAAGQALSAKLTSAEDSLYQTKNRSGQDPLNFPIKLNNRIAALGRSVETGDAKPTAAAYVVFKELSANLDAQLDALNSLFDTDLAHFNAMLKAKHLDAVQVPRPELTP